MDHRFAQGFAFLVLVALPLFSTPAAAQENSNSNKFRQLYQELATPNAYRNGAGAPGYKYYQQQADYDIAVTLDDEKQRISGSETITYHNNSPDPLAYLWLQLDQNVREPNSLKQRTSTQQIKRRNQNFRKFQEWHSDFEGGHHIEKVVDRRGNNLPYTINETMMRIDLPEPLQPGDEVEFSIDWWYNIQNRKELGGRSGYEYFEENGNYLYTIAQFFPRMCVYNDVEGWQNLQFLGRGEFALDFGDYQVAITVPADHVVSATGQLQNPRQVLSSTQQKRLEQARSSHEEPVMIVTEEEARKNEKQKAKGTKTWEFEAENVRDFAFATSRKFIWDAMGVQFGDRTVMAMSFYPKEGNPLWEQYSTKVVAHTLETYSDFTFDYPYPVAQSIHSWRIGMEYPMICFNYGRPQEDGTYSERMKYGMISVIIHEVGHNFFPMIVNSDERQWTWMDEGLNSFLQFLTEQEFQHGYPSRRGFPHKIVPYMKGDKSSMTPIMTQSDQITHFGDNAYGKPATALNILRETVLGRELFDYAFKTYAQRWKFKHPTPEDLFRSLEDASGTDLDWFWRGWFFTTDHVDIAIQDVNWKKINPRKPKEALSYQETQDKKQKNNITNKRNMKLKTELEKDTSLRDFYNRYDPYAPTLLDKKAYKRYMKQLDEEDKKLFAQDYNYYEVTFENIGGLPMPLILKFTYEDGSSEIKRIPAQVWRYDNKRITKLFWSKKRLKSLEQDPYYETADTDTENNHWPRKQELSLFKLYKNGYSSPGKNKMQQYMELREKNEKGK